MENGSKNTKEEEDTKAKYKTNKKIKNRKTNKTADYKSGYPGIIPLLMLMSPTF